jgi:hypothetical protein
MMSSAAPCKEMEDVGCVRAVQGTGFVDLKQGLIFDRVDHTLLLLALPGKSISSGKGLARSQTDDSKTYCASA